MNERSMAGVTLGCCLSIIALLGLGVLQIRDLTDELGLRTQQRRAIVVTYTAHAVKNMAGQESDVVTQRNDGETAAQHAARHLEAINAWKATGG